MTEHKFSTHPADTILNRNGKFTVLTTIILVMLLSASWLIMLGCGGADSSETDDTVAETVVHERFDLKNPLNKRYQWSDFVGDPFIINFWATWCGPCRREMPVLKKLYAEYHPRGLEIIGISLDGPRTRQLVVPFVEQFEIPWVVLYGEQSVVDEFDPGSSIPTTLFFDAEGNEVSRIVGAQPEAAFRRELNKLFPSTAQK